CPRRLPGDLPSLPPLDPRGRAHGRRSPGDRRGARPHQLLHRPELVRPRPDARLAPQAALAPGPPLATPPAVRVRVPATSANVGPGFDVLGVALALYNEVELAEGDEVRVEIEGEGQATLPRDERNVLVRGTRAVHDRAARPFRGLRVRQSNRIPPSRGLGSSASAWLAGMLGANALLGEPLAREEVMDLAVLAEGHPDNL